MDGWCIFSGYFKLPVLEGRCEDSEFKLKAPPSECE